MKDQDDKEEIDIIILKIKSPQYSLIYMRYEFDELKNVQIIEKEPLTSDEYR